GGKDRGGVRERFGEDAACRVFLSTDAGGTGLNLQAADTVVNLEVPWNPAVLNQRVARVHRMGQHRPVQVINLVTRGTIEGRVLQTLDLKKSLFDGVFAGTSDEVDFSALGRQAFMDTVRTLVAPPELPPPPKPPVSPEAGQALIQAGVQLLEGLAAMLAPAGAGNGRAASPLAAFVGTDARTG